jgi:hypothetical protein
MTFRFQPALEFLVNEIRFTPALEPRELILLIIDDSDGHVKQRAICARDGCE